MTRNLDNRVEVTCPIHDSKIKKEINDIFNIYWSDNVKSRLINQKDANLYKSDIYNDSQNENLNLKQIGIIFSLVILISLLFPGGEALKYSYKIQCIFLLRQ